MQFNCIIIQVLMMCKSVANFPSSEGKKKRMKWNGKIIFKEKEGILLLLFWWTKEHFTAVMITNSGTGFQEDRKASLIILNSIDHQLLL